MNETSSADEPQSRTMTPLPDDRDVSEFLATRQIWEILQNVQQAGQRIPDYFFMCDLPRSELDRETEGVGYLGVLNTLIYVAFSHKTNFGNRRSASLRTKAKQVYSLKVQCTKLLATLEELGVNNNYLNDPSQWSLLNDMRYDEKTGILLSRFSSLARFLQSAIQDADDVLAEFEKIAAETGLAPGIRYREERTEEEAFIYSLEDTFRRAIVQDRGWTPKPRFNKSQGADPFSVFVASVKRAIGDHISDESASRIVRRAMDARMTARTRLEK